MFNIIFGVLLAAFAAGAIWAFLFSKKVKKEGVETEAVVSRIEEHEWVGDAVDPDRITVCYYITYTNQEGQAVEALLSNPKGLSFDIGSRMKIKYLPDRQEYPVLTEIL